MRSIFVLSCLCIILGTGCISRRSLYAVNEEVPAKSTTYHQVVQRLGNPTVVETLPNGDIMAVYAGQHGLGGGFSLSYPQIPMPLLKFERIHQVNRSIRFIFSYDGKLKTTVPFGDTAHWDCVPFGDRY